jgi:AcrR family transcriptional regulator
VPTQERAQVTVEAMLDAAVKLLKKSGSSAITTNRIAEAAGVSIGSVYQYFPNKRAIFIALHERHIAQVDSVLCGRLAKSAELTLDELIDSLADGMIELHSADPELSELLQAEVPHRAEGTRDFSVRLHGNFRKALAAHSKELGRKLAGSRHRASTAIRFFPLTNEGGDATRDAGVSAELSHALQREISSSARFRVRGPIHPITAITTSMAAAMNANTPVVPKLFSTPAIKNEVKIAEKRLQE